MHRSMSPITCSCRGRVGVRAHPQSLQGRMPSLRYCSALYLHATLNFSITVLSTDSMQ